MFVKELIPPIALRIKRYVFNKPQEFKSHFKTLTQNNIDFKNIHNGKRVFILASGPSIKTQDLKQLQYETCIAVSHFHLHDDIKIIKPKYHILAPQHTPFNFNDSSKYFVDFKKSYSTNDTHIFLGLNNYEYNYIELLKTYPELEMQNLHYLDYSQSLNLDEANFNDDSIWDITKSLFGMRTVIYGAIQVAYYMGFKEIYLLGCDHDYLNDISRTSNHHFYKEEKGISDKNHLEQFTREKWFFEYYMRWKQYRLINMYLNSHGVKLYNATKGGMLDVFEKIEFTDIIK